MRIALLISGGGTTAAAILSAVREGRLTGVEPACVIASTAEAGGLQKVRPLGMPENDILVIDPKNFDTSEAFGQAIIAACQARGVEFIGQYGWMCLTPGNVIEAFAGNMVNQHPGPLDPGHPDFGGKGMYGRRVHCARLLFVQRTGRESWTEATAQRVAVQFDEGAVLRAGRVPILPNDTVESLVARVLPVEHEVQIATLQDFVNGTVREVVRTERLVRPEEGLILEEVKQEARRLYPKG